MNQVVIALGSNIDKERNLPLAVAMLRQTSRITAVSAVYETIPVGLLNQPNFWNMAVLLKTDLSPAQLKQTVIGPIEVKLKRIRQADPNAPRTIDIDIVLFNEMVGDYDGGDGRLRRNVPIYLFIVLKISRGGISINYENEYEYKYKKEPPGFRQKSSIYPANR